MHREDRRLDRARRAVPRMGAERRRGRSPVSGKGSARRRTSDARRYADGWMRVFGRGRGRRDPGGKEGHVVVNVKKVRKGIDNTKRLAYVVNHEAKNVASRCGTPP